MTRSFPPPRRSFGPHTGAGAFLGGIGFVLGSPSVWPYACVPVLVALVLTCGLGYLGVEAARRLAESLFESAAAQWLVRALATLVFLAVSALLGLVLAQPLSGFALEAIARKQELRLTGRQPPEPGFLTALWIGLRCTLFTLLVGGSITVLLFAVSVAFAPAAVVTVPLNFLVVGWFLAWDLLDYPLGLRGHGIRRRLGWVRRHFGGFTAFGLCWACVLMIPGIALLVLPMGVAGAARLVVAADAASEGEVRDALPA